MAKPTRYTVEKIREYYKSGEWFSFSMPELWDKNAELFPEREAVVDGKMRVTWVQAKKYIDRIAAGLGELGFKKDDVLVIQLPNSVELVLLRVACEKAGVLCLPILRNLRHRDVENILSRVDAFGVAIPWKYRDFDYVKMIMDLSPKLTKLKKIIVVDNIVPPGTISFRDILNNPIESKDTDSFFKGRCYSPDEVSLINHTTGTTGFPKFVEYPMAARLRLARGFVETLKLSDKDTICALGSVPAGANTVAYFGAPLAASKLVMLEHFEAEDALKTIEKEKVTVACGVPAMWSMLVRHPKRRDYDLSSVRLWWNAGAFLSPQLAMEVERELGGLIMSGLGAADFGGTIIPEISDSSETRFLTVGKPKAGTEIKLVGENGGDVAEGEVGEIWGTGPACASGYYLDPEATWTAWTKDGWFKTGDLGRFDEEGNLILAGRKKDIIIRGGQNIYPAEVESLLAAHPHVAEVAVVGMPDPVMGEKACAYVVPKPGEIFIFLDMVEYLKKMDIAHYKIPERLECIGYLPMVGGETKIDKKTLMKDIADKLKAEQ